MVLRFNPSEIDVRSSQRMINNGNIKLSTFSRPRIDCDTNRVLYLWLSIARAPRHLLPEETRQIGERARQAAQLRPPGSHGQPSALQSDSSIE